MSGDKAAVLGKITNMCDAYIVTFLHLSKILFWVKLGHFRGPLSDRGPKKIRNVIGLVLVGLAALVLVFNTWLCFEGHQNCEYYTSGKCQEIMSQNPLSQMFPKWK